jgi:hypothetical protein
LNLEYTSFQKKKVRTVPVQQPQSGSGHSVTSETAMPPVQRSSRTAAPVDRTQLDQIDVDAAAAADDPPIDDGDSSHSQPATAPVHQPFLHPDQPAASETAPPLGPESLSGQHVQTPPSTPRRAESTPVESTPRVSTPATNAPKRRRRRVSAQERREQERAEAARMQEEAAQARWTEAQHRTFGDFGTFKSSTPPGEQDPKPNSKAQGPPPAGPPPPPPPPQSSPGFNPWARPRPFGPRPMPFSPWASYQAPLPPHLWPEAFFRMTHHLAMHNMINELSAYIFTARGLAFNVAKYQPVYPPPFVRV